MLFSIAICVCVVFAIAKLVAVLTAVRCKSNVCLVGKTAIVTGGNSGLGLGLVKALAARGCRVIIIDKDDAQETVRSVIRETHNSQVSFRRTDLSKLDEVRKLAEDLNSSLTELHILVNNAGLVENKDGKKAFTVNYFSHFLLTHLLADKLIKSAPSRILNSSSSVAYFKAFEKPECDDFFDPVLTYQHSKLSMAISSSIFADKLKEVGVTSNCFHPGMVKTNLWSAVLTFQCRSYNIFRYYLGMVVTALFGKTIEEGIQTILHLAIADEVENISGKFFMECIPCYQPRKVYDKDFCLNFWEYSDKFVGLKTNEKLDFVVKKYVSESSN